MPSKKEIHQQECNADLAFISRGLVYSLRSIVNEARTLFPFSLCCEKSRNWGIVGMLLWLHSRLVRNICTPFLQICLCPSPVNFRDTWSYDIRLLGLPFNFWTKIMRESMTHKIGNQYRVFTAFHASTDQGGAQQENGTAVLCIYLVEGDNKTHRERRFKLRLPRSSIGSSVFTSDPFYLYKTLHIGRFHDKKPCLFSKQ